MPVSIDKGISWLTVSKSIHSKMRCVEICNEKQHFGVGTTAFFHENAVPTLKSCY